MVSGTPVCSRLMELFNVGVLINMAKVAFQQSFNKALLVTHRMLAYTLVVLTVEPS